MAAFDSSPLCALVICSDLSAHVLAVMLSVVRAPSVVTLRVKVSVHRLHSVVPLWDRSISCSVAHSGHATVTVEFWAPDGADC